MYIDYDACVECGVFRRLEICPEGAIKQVDEIPYPRIIRAAFLDPTHRHATTEVLGRGTEEMKTNDVKNEFTLGLIGFSIELGRPGLGAYLKDLDKVTRKTESNSGISGIDCGYHRPDSFDSGSGGKGFRLAAASKSQNLMRPSNHLMRCFQ